MRVAVVAALLVGLAVTLSASERDAGPPVRQPALESSGASAPRSLPPGADTPLDGLPQAQWPGAPRLVVLMSVMQYQPGAMVEYQASGEVLTAVEADELIADLTEGLRMLTGDRFLTFAAIDREYVSPGSLARIVRTGRIVVGRFQGIREARRTLGLGGRVTTRGQAISSAAVLLDEGYDRNGGNRRLLRIHELGHALGYDHVDTRPSVMNPQIGHPPTPLDLVVARRAFAERP